MGAAAPYLIRPARQASARDRLTPAAGRVVCSRERKDARHLFRFVSTLIIAEGGSGEDSLWERGGCSGGRSAVGSDRGAKATRDPSSTCEHEYESRLRLALYFPQIKTKDHKGHTPILQNQSRLPVTMRHLVSIRLARGVEGDILTSSSEARRG